MSVVIFCVMSAAIMAGFGIADRRDSLQQSSIGAFVFAIGLLTIGIVYALYLGGVL